MSVKCSPQNQCVELRASSGFECYNPVRLTASADEAVRVRRLVVTGFVLATVSALANGSVSNAELEQKYGNAVLTLRQFYPGSTLNFDENGQPVNPSQPGPWTLYGQLRVQEISFKDGVLQIHG